MKGSKWTLSLSFKIVRMKINRIHRMKYEPFRSCDGEFSPGPLKILKAALFNNLLNTVYTGQQYWHLYHSLVLVYYIESHVIHDSRTSVYGILMSSIYNYAKTELLLCCCSVTKMKVLDASGPPGFPSLLGGASDTTITTAISALSFSPDGEVCFNDTTTPYQVTWFSYMGLKLRTLWFKTIYISVHSDSRILKFIVQ